MNSTTPTRPLTLEDAEMELYIRDLELRAMAFDLAQARASLRQSEASRWVSGLLATIAGNSTLQGTRA